MRHALPLLTILFAALHLGAAERGPIAVVHLERIFEEAALVEAKSVELREAAHAVKDAVDTMTEQIQADEALLATYSPSMQQHAELREKIEVAKLRRKLFFERNQKALQARELQLLRESYDEIRALLAAYAIEQGLGLVLTLPSHQLSSDAGPELRLELATKTVLWASDQADITQDFLEYANRRHATTGNDEDSAPAIDLGAE